MRIRNLTKKLELVIRNVCDFNYKSMRVRNLIRKRIGVGYPMFVIPFFNYEFMIRIRNLTRKLELMKHT